MEKVRHPILSKSNHKLLAVYWEDSRRSSDMYSPEELKEFPCAYIWTIGFGYELEDKVVLASEFYPELTEQKEMYRNVYSIPKTCILQVITLGEFKA